jgi:hypothetical protein
LISASILLIRASSSLKAACRVSVVTWNEVGSRILRKFLRTSCCWAVTDFMIESSSERYVMGRRSRFRGRRLT